MATKSQQAAAKALQWTHMSGPQPSNWHLNYSGLSRGWENFKLTIIKLPRHIINQLVYYFVVRCVTFTMQTEILMSAQEQCIFFLEAVTWKTRLSGYLASTEWLILKSPPSHHRDSPVSREFTDSSLSILQWLSTTNRHVLQHYNQPAWPRSHISAHWFFIISSTTVAAS